MLRVMLLATATWLRRDEISLLSPSCSCFTPPLRYADVCLSGYFARRDSYAIVTPLPLLRWCVDMRCALCKMLICASAFDFSPISALFFDAVLPCRYFFFFDFDATPLFDAGCYTRAASPYVDDAIVAVACSTPTIRCLYNIIHITILMPMIYRHCLFSPLPHAERRRSFMIRVSSAMLRLSRREDAR